MGWPGRGRARGAGGGLDRALMRGVALGQGGTGPRRTFFIILSVSPIPAKAPHRDPERTSASEAVNFALSPPGAPLRGRRRHHCGSSIPRSRDASGMRGHHWHEKNPGSCRECGKGETVAAGGPQARCSVLGNHTLTWLTPGSPSRCRAAAQVAHRRLRFQRSPSSSSSAKRRSRRQRARQNDSSRHAHGPGGVGTALKEGRPPSSSSYSPSLARSSCSQPRWRCPSPRRRPPLPCRPTLPCSLTTR